MGTRPRTVAVVEDNPSMRTSVERLLNACGLTTKGYPSAEAFLSHATPAELGCVVLDMHLAGISGMELRRRPKSTHSRLPVISITAIVDDALELKARRVGCVAYLQKPFAAASLIAAVKEALAGDATD
ncbi:two-component system response regulator (plasmid) [Sinorhizobium meliloti]|uniref:response regulator transcription factor n=1 Tax=Rhizobium meliloti TaxID=382 RepID=UPI000B49D5DB|nr:response regulator [Sinorhizobium meliloti]ASP87348.1 two-component system response regulator [Sinorhizobium meliloti]MQW29262.1 response regulator [Sinorhizobium meliloti]